jgi:hypothetical protein
MQGRSLLRGDLPSLNDVVWLVGIMSINCGSGEVEN